MDKSLYKISVIDFRNCTKKVEERVIRFQKSQKKNWLGLNNSFHEIFNEYVTDIAMKLVIYSPSLNVFR